MRESKRQLGQTRPGSAVPRNCGADGSGDSAFGSFVVILLTLGLCYLVGAILLGCLRLLGVELF